MTEHTYDVVVIGGGLIGLCAAVAMDVLGYRTLVVERRDEQAVSNDRRVLAMSDGSRLILQRLGTWSAISDVTPITEIIVSDEGNPQRVVLSATECEVEALGHVTHFSHMSRMLQSQLRALKSVHTRYGCDASLVSADAKVARVELRDATVEEISTALVIHAEGASGLSDLEDKSYGQWAIVNEIRCDNVHPGRAYEHFTEGGPVALLPVGEYFALIWTVPDAQREELLQLDSPTFCGRLEQRLGFAAGSIQEHGDRTGFPLKLRKARYTTGERSVRIGNAAQQLHPVAAQGFNLGLRDLWELHECLWNSSADPGAPSSLEKFAGSRQRDRDASIFITDSMVSIFGSHHPVIRASRGAALAAFAKFKSLRELLAHRMMFGSR